jgi:LacI family transcriptional regulator
MTPDGTLTAAGDWSSASGYGATLELVDHDSGFTALFAQNDRMAMGAIRALHERGLRVPEDVAVVGFDDIPAAPYFCPSLTTVHHPFYEVGRSGARLLIDLINGQPVRSNPVRLETKLIIRQSCGAQGSAR